MTWPVTAGDGGAYRAGSDGVDPNSARAVFGGPRSGQRLEGGPACAVHGHSWPAEAGDHGADVDDGAHPRAAMAGARAATRKKGTLTLIVKVSSNSASVPDSDGPSKAVPTLLTRMST